MEQDNCLVLQARLQRQRPQRPILHQTSESYSSWMYWLQSRRKLGIDHHWHLCCHLEEQQPIVAHCNISRWLTLVRSRWETSIVCDLHVRRMYISFRLKGNAYVDAPRWRLKKSTLYCVKFDVAGSSLGSYITFRADKTDWKYSTSRASSCITFSFSSIN